MTKVVCPECDPMALDPRDPAVTTGLCAHHAREHYLAYMRTQGKLALVPVTPPSGNTYVDAVLAVVTRRALARTLPERKFSVYYNTRISRYVVYDSWLGDVARYQSQQDAYSRLSQLRNNWRDRRP